MGLVSALFLTIFLSFNLLISCNTTAHKSLSFIISVQNGMKPTEFSDVENWYNSILENLSSNSLFPQNNRKITHIYKTVFHGFSTKLALHQVEELKKHPAILGVLQDRKRHIQTTRSPGFLGIDTATRTRINNDLLQKSNYGSNVIIGVLDTGIFPEGKSFQDNGLDPIPSHWKGECVGGNDFPKTPCNKKIIGARYFDSEETGITSARDQEGHGSHSSLIMAGLIVNNASFLGFANGEASGIAEKARLAVYKVCWVGVCKDSDVLAGLDKAVEDGVDIIPMSFGSDTSIPYFLDPSAIGSFGAMEKGVFVSASAGNSGFQAESVRNVAPWIMTVGASTINRKFPADLLLEDSTHSLSM